MTSHFRPCAVALAIAASTGAAHAQSAVTIYGIVDVAATSVSGLRGGTETQLASGMMDGSRLGVRVNEDLGGGLRALAVLEHRLEADTGTSSNRPITGTQLPDRLSNATLMGLPSALQPIVTQVGTSLATSAFGVNLNNAFWDRQSYIGLVTPVGAFLAGRQYTPAYETIAVFEALGTQSALSMGQVAAFPPAVDIRMSNAMQYRIQLGGLTASAMVTAPEGSATTGKLYGAMAHWKSDRFSAGIGYNTRDNEVGAKSLTTTVLGGTATFGPATLHGVYAKIEDDNPTGVSGVAAGIPTSVSRPVANAVQDAFSRALQQDADVWQIGTRLTMAPHTVYVAYNRYDDKRLADADTSSYGVVYTYALSRRTDINAGLVRFDNDGLGQAAPGNAGYLGGVTSTAGTDSTSVSIGIRHRF